MQKPTADIKTDFVAQAPTGEGPDLIVGAHDWTGELVSNGLISPIELGDKGKLADNTIAAFQYDGALYGVPYAVENIALVLDEPLRGLDPEAAILMNTVIERTAGAGNGVLIATHDLFAAERGCDEVVIVSEGRVVTQGAPAELLERHRAANLEALFLALTGIGTGLERKLQHLTHTLDPDRIDPVATEVSGGIS